MIHIENKLPYLDSIPWSSTPEYFEVVISLWDPLSTMFCNSPWWSKSWEDSHPLRMTTDTLYTWPYLSCSGPWPRERRTHSQKNWRWLQLRDFIKSTSSLTSSNNLVKQPSQIQLSETYAKNGYVPGWSEWLRRRKNLGKQLVNFKRNLSRNRIF